MEQLSLKDNEFVFDVPLHAGENLCRVKYTESISVKYRISKASSVFSEVKTATYKIDRQKKCITFAAEIHFELYDRSGNILWKGSGTGIDVSFYDGELF